MAEANVIVWERVGQAQRRALDPVTILEVHGELQQQDGATHLIADPAGHLLVQSGELLTVLPRFSLTATESAAGGSGLCAAGKRTGVQQRR